MNRTVLTVLVSLMLFLGLFLAESEAGWRRRRTCCPCYPPPCSGPATVSGAAAAALTCPSCGGSGSAYTCMNCPNGTWQPSQTGTGYCVLSTYQGYTCTGYYAAPHHHSGAEQLYAMVIDGASHQWRDAHDGEQVGGYLPERYRGQHCAPKGK